MAELKQDTFGVDTNFQSITPTKDPDFRAENIKSGIALADGLGRASASKAGRDAAGDLTGQSLKEANRDLDIFEETLNNNITDAQVAAGGTLTARQVAEIKDETLRNANIKSKGLQEGIISGQLSHLEATARANLEVQKASNSLVGSLFQNEFRNAFSKVTGSPAGSPAVILNKSPAEIQEEANRKAIVSANADRTKQIHSQMAKDGSTFESAEFKLVASENAQAEEAAGKRLDAENLRTDNEVVSKAGTQFVVALSPLMDNITAAQNSGRGIDPTEAATLTVQIKNITDTIVNTHIARGLGKTGQKDLREVAQVWADKQTAYIEDISAGKITKDQQELIATASKNLLASEMPLVYAISKSGMPELAQQLARMEPDARKEYVSRLGLDVKEMLDLSKEFVGLTKVASSGAKPSPSEAGSLAPVMSKSTGDSNKKVLDQYEENVGDLSDLLPEWKAAPEESLRTVADTLGPQIQANDKNSVKVGVDIINASRDKYFRLIADLDVPTDFEYTIDKNPGLRNPRINIPDGIPDGEQQILRQLYRAVAATPSLWREDYASPQLAFEAVMKGHKLSSPDEQIGPSNSIGEFFTDLGHSISNFADTQSSRIRNTEGIQLTEDTARRVEEIRNNLIRQSDVDAMLNDMGEEELSALESKLGIVPSTTQVSDTVTASGIGGGEARDTGTVIPNPSAIESLPAATEGATLTGNQNQPVVNTSNATIQRSQNLQGERGVGTSSVIKEINPDVDREVQLRVQDFENASKTGFDGTVWKPHKSLEGGTDTVAYGHKLTSQEAKSNSVKIGSNSIDLDKGITESQAQELFQQDWTKAGKGAKKIIADNGLGSMPAKAKSILQEMVFQMGEKGVSLFKTTIKFLKSGEFDKAADNMLNSKWAKQDSPNRAKILAEEMRGLSK